MLPEEVRKEPPRAVDREPVSTHLALHLHDASLSIGARGRGACLDAPSILATEPALRAWAESGPFMGHLPVGQSGESGPAVGYRPDVDMADVSRARRAFRNGQARALREEAGLSIRELAAFAGLPRASLQNWEAGTSTPRPEGALAWANAMKRLGFRI